MQASVQCRSIGMVMKEVDDDVEFSLDLWSRENKTSQNFLQDPNDFSDQFGIVKNQLLLGSIQENSLTQGKTSTLPKRKSGADDFLSSESDRTDYEWLLTASGNPMFPSLEMEMEKIATGEFGISGSHHAVPESEVRTPEESLSEFFACDCFQFT
ncbi:hypothetical protein RHGRI_015474 [Rhododendron griersonianum]|uniref:Uncharacterized protein n=1 Tax=Rhododendron griersonianum TaxID=479676 RepID=A0AAV6KDL5_9ERIC|nr:hypothetical protein RHGRI_015474 [Rhododendron griersonianum]